MAFVTWDTLTHMMTVDLFVFSVTPTTAAHILASSYNPAFITAHGGTVAGAEADLLAVR